MPKLYRRINIIPPSILVRNPNFKAGTIAITNVVLVFLIMVSCSTNG